MSFAYEIDGWLDGVKITRPSFDWSYIHFINGIWYNKNGFIISDKGIANLFHCVDWKIYQEPKKKIHEYWNREMYYKVRTRLG